MENEKLNIIEDLNLSTERSRIDYFTETTETTEKQSELLGNSTNPIIDKNIDPPGDVNKSLDDLLIGGNLSDFSSEENNKQPELKVAGREKKEIIERKEPITEKSNSSDYNPDEIREIFRKELDSFNSPNVINNSTTIIQQPEQKVDKLFSNEQRGDIIDRILEKTTNTDNIKNQSNNITEINAIVVPPSVDPVKEKTETPLPVSTPIILEGDSTIIVPSSNTISSKLVELNQPISKFDQSNFNDVSNTVNSTNPTLSNTNRFNNDYSIISSTSQEILPSVNNRSTQINESIVNSSSNMEISNSEIEQNRPPEITNVSILPSESTSIKETVNTNTFNESNFKTEQTRVNLKEASVTPVTGLSVLSEVPRLETIKQEKIKESLSVPSNIKDEKKQEEVIQKPKASSETTIKKVEESIDNTKPTPTLPPVPPQIDIKRLESLMEQMVTLLKQPLLTIDAGIKYS